MNLAGTITLEQSRAENNGKEVVSSHSPESQNWNLFTV